MNSSFRELSQSEWLECQAWCNHIFNCPCIDLQYHLKDDQTANHKGMAEGKKSQKMRTMERQMSLLISLQKKSQDRCMNIDYSKHQFIDRTACCPYTDNRSELVKMAGTWTCWRECLLSIDLARLVRTESYLCRHLQSVRLHHQVMTIDYLQKQAETLTNT